MQYYDRKREFSLLQYLTKETQIYRPLPLESLAQQVELTNYYATYANERYQQIQRDISQSKYMFSLATHLQDQQTENMKESMGLYKLERDIWLLLDYLTRSNLFHTIDDQQNYDNLISSLDRLSVHATIPEVIHTAYQADERLRKGAVLVKWLEECSIDSIDIVPTVSSSPWNSTVDMLVKAKANRKNLNNRPTSSHPDAQLSRNMELLPLHQDDAYDQEVVLKYIWQLLRSGQLAKAQAAAVDHKIYWLSATLLGGSDYHYKQVASSDTSALVHQETTPVLIDQSISVGNIRKPMWKKTCWKYSTMLSENPKNSIQNQVRLE